MSEAPASPRARAAPRGRHDIYLALFLCLFTVLSGYAASERAAAAHAEDAAPLAAPAADPYAEAGRSLAPLAAPGEAARDWAQSWHLRLEEGAIFIGATAAVRPEAAARLRAALAALAPKGSEPRRRFVLSLHAGTALRPLDRARIEALARLLAEVPPGVDVMLALDPAAAPVLVRISDGGP